MTQDMNMWLSGQISAINTLVVNVCSTLAFHDVEASRLLRDAIYPCNKALNHLEQIRNAEAEQAKPE